MRLRTEGIASRELDGETVVLHLQRSQYLSINASGTLLLRLLQEERQLDELVEAVVRSYDVDEVTARRDVAAFLIGLEGAGLLDQSADGK